MLCVCNPVCRNKKEHFRLLEIHFKKLGGEGRNQVLGSEAVKSVAGAYLVIKLVLGARELSTQIGTDRLFG